MKYRFLSLLALLTFSFTSCDVDQTREAEMPEVSVDVDTEPGTMPAYDVDWADVDVTTTTKVVDMPKVRVVMEEETIEVPVVDVDWPQDYGDTEERTLMVEADVDQDANIDIEEVYTNGERIIVLAQLNKNGEMLQDETMRVSDQVVLNAPDLDVRYYIIGDRPEGLYNNRYKYISDRSEIQNLVQNGKVIYSAAK